MSVMIAHPNTYFSQWIPDRTELLMVLEEEAEQQGIPIVGPVVGTLLYLLANIKGARNIVELGTATGYSAIFMGKACRSNNGRLTTFEADPEMAARAAHNIEKADLDQWVRVRYEDALEGLRRLEQPADMIFMDIEKEDYALALPLCKENLGEKGLLVADNTGFQDAHAFNRVIFEDAEWESVNLWTFLPGHSPENDGLCIASKRS